MWCGILPYDAIGSYSTAIKGILPAFMQPMVTFSSVDTVIKCFEPWLYGLALFLPILIILITWLVMGCRKTCCSCFSMWCCPICNLFTVLICFVLLMLTFMYSGVLKPITDQLQTDLAVFTDAGLSGASMAGIDLVALKNSVPSSIMSTDAIKLTLQNGDLDFSTTAKLVASVKLNLKLDVAKLVPAGSGAASGNVLMDMLGINLDDPMSMVTPVLTFLNTTLAAYSNLDITLTGTNVSGLMNGNAVKGVLQLICLNNKPILTFVNELITTLLNGLLNDAIPALNGLINPDLAKINAMDDTIFTSLGFSLSSVSGIADNIYNDVTNVINKLTTPEADMVRQGDLLDLYDVVTQNLKGGSGSVSSGTKYLNGLSFLYGAYNEYQFLYGTAPPLNTLAPLTAAMITEPSMANRLAFINSLNVPAIGTWLNSIDGSCNFLDSIGTIAQKFTDRDSITYDKGAYCTVLQNYKMADYATKLTTAADIFRTLMVSVIRTPLTAIQTYTSNTGIVKQISDVVVAILKGAFTAVDTRLDFAYPQNLLQPPFAATQFMSKLNTYLSAVIGSVIDLVASDQSLLNTELLGLIPSTLADAVGVVLGWLDWLSFAVYLMFLYYFLGSMFMAFSYSYVKLVQEEKRVEKKYKVKQFQKIKCGKNSYQPMM